MRIQATMPGLNNATQQFQTCIRDICSHPSHGPSSLTPPMPHHLALLDTSRRLRSVVVVGIVVSLLDLALGACAGSRTQLNLAGRPSRLVAAMRSTHDKEAHARRSAEFKADTVVIEMRGDANGYVFTPDTVHIHTGDLVTWKMVSGGPHNIAFSQAAAGDAADVINRNMAAKMAYLSSPLLMNPGEAFTVPFNNVPPGTYEYHCTPHLAMGQRGVIIVDP
jgi:plastocyanin